MTLSALLLFFACSDDKGDTGDDTGPILDDTDTPTDDSAPPVDADDDGFSTPDDCDDDDPLVHPGAEEICNGIDDDCNDQVDDDATDASVFYTDADGDGYGDPDDTVTACDQPTGTSTDPSDCDDDDETINPDAIEVCDGIDNDCDTQVDPVGWRVPDDHTSIQAAIDAASKKGDVEVCIQAGKYVENLDTGGVDITLTGVGADLVTIDGGGTGRVLQVDNAETVTVRGVTITGGLDGHGAGLYVEQSALILEDVVVEGNHALAEEDDDAFGAGMAVFGGFVEAYDTVFRANLAEGYCDKDACSDEAYGAAILVTGAANVTLDGCEIQDNEATGANIVQGALFAQSGDITIANTTFEGNQAAPQGVEADTLYVWGADLTVEDTDSFSMVGSQLVDATVECPGTTNGCYVQGGALAVTEATVSFEDVAIIGTAVTVDATNSQYCNGAAVHLAEDALLEWTGGEVSDVSASIAKADAVNAYLNGTVFGSSASLTLSGVDFLRNTLDSSVSNNSGYSYGGAFYLASGMVIDAANLWIADNTVTGGEHAYGGGVYSTAGSGELRSVIIVNNAVSSQDSAHGGAINVAYLGPLDVINADIIGNTVTSVDGNAYGGGYRISGLASGSLVNANVIGNTASTGKKVGPFGGGVTRYPSGVGDFNLAYTNIWDNDGGLEVVLYGMDVKTLDGILSANPGYTDVSSKDPLAWDLSLSKGSVCIDAGDPKILDADASTSDIGAYGGPDGASW